MKRFRTLSISLTALMAVAITGAAFAGSGKNFTAHLSGQNEVPAVDTKAQGQTTLKLSKDGTELHFRLIVANIEGVTQAHIHCGAPDVNGPVVAFLFGLEAEGVTVNGVLATGVITDVVVQPDSDACPGGVASFEDLLAKMRTGEAYVNVHTLENPGGEIRGPIR